MTKPTFFIIGAPKCGTTALSEYLREHPRIGFSAPKEPIYFCTDFPKARRFTEEKEYLEQCFGHCRNRDVLAVGEGSTLYFYSAEAVPNILDFEPEARFIIMLRNPVDMVPALHAQRLAGLEEDVTHFEKAWFLQADRLAGKKRPKFCPDIRLVHYANQGRLGMHLQRIFSQIPEDRRMVIVFDDFAREPRKVYAEVLSFLGVPDDGRTDFPRINERPGIKVQALYEFGHRPPESLMKYVNAAKNILGIRRLNLLPRVLAWTQTQGKRKTLSPKMRNILRAEFAEDIDLLSALLKRDLSHWKA
jgi:hypothetical protein